MSHYTVYFSLVLFLIKVNYYNCAKPLTMISSIDVEQGYISDLGRISDKKCFIDSLSRYSNLQVRGNFSQSMDYDEMLKELDIEDFLETYQYSLETDHFMSYLNLIGKNDFSISKNYYSITSKRRMISYPMGFSILSQEGKRIWEENPEKFRLECGDRLISSYEIGVGFFVSIKFFFHKETDRMRFGYIGQFKPLEKVLDYIQEVATISRINGYMIIYGLQLNSKDNFLNSKVKGFTLCKSTSLTKISEQCYEWISFITNYINNDNLHDITRAFVDNSPLDELEPLFNYTLDESLSLHLPDFPSSLLTPSIINGTNNYFESLNIKKLILNRLDHIQEMASYKPPEVSTFRGIFHKYLTNIYEEKKVIKCINDISDRIECLKRVPELLLVTEDIEEFLNRFNKIKQFQIRLSNSFCLNGLLSWEGDMIISLSLYYNKTGGMIPYLEIDDVDNTLLCQRLHHNDTHYIFNCTENLIYLQFTIDKDDDGKLDNRKLTCYNPLLNYREETTLKILSLPNPLGFSIRNLYVHHSIKHRKPSYLDLDPMKDHDDYYR